MSKMIKNDRTLEHDDVLRIANGSQDVNLETITDADRKRLTEEYHYRITRNPGPEMESGLNRYMEHLQWEGEMFRKQHSTIASMTINGLLMNVEYREEYESHHGLGNPDRTFFKGACRDELARRISAGEFKPDGEQIQLLKEIGINVTELFTEQQIAIEQEIATEQEKPLEILPELQTSIELEDEAEKDKEEK